MSHFHQYCPKTSYGKIVPLLLGGDGLSFERAIGAQRARLDAVTVEDRFDGLIPTSEDWHAHVIALHV